MVAKFGEIRGVESLREVGEQGAAGGIPKRAGAGRNRIFCFGI